DADCAYPCIAQCRKPQRAFIEVSDTQNLFCPTDLRRQLIKITKEKAQAQSFELALSSSENRTGISVLFSLPSSQSSSREHVWPLPSLQELSQPPSSPEQPSSQEPTFSPQ